MIFLLTSSAYLIVKFDVSAVGLLAKGILRLRSVPSAIIAVVPLSEAVSTVPA